VLYYIARQYLASTGNQERTALIDLGHTRVAKDFP
jgi:hypothetical protein